MKRRIHDVPPVSGWMLTDHDERIRALAAQGLARLREPRALDALVRTIDDFPDVLRQPFTPSADELINLGPSLLSRVALLLDAQQLMTRARAFLVIRMIVSTLPEANNDWQALWRALGSYDPAATAPERERKHSSGGTG